MHSDGNHRPVLMTLKRMSPESASSVGLLWRVLCPQTWRVPDYTYDVKVEMGIAEGNQLLGKNIMRW